MMVDKNVKNIKSTTLKFFISGFLLFLLYITIDKKALITNLQLFDFKYAPIILILLVLNYVISSVRWKNLLSIYSHAEKVSTKYLISLYFIGSFFNNFMPTSIGGDVYKILKLGKKIDSKANAFSATFMERFTGMIALVFIALFGFLITFSKGISGFEAEIGTIGFTTFLCVVVLIVGWFVGVKILAPLSTKIPKLESLYKSISQYKNNYKVLLVAFISSFLVQICSIFSQYFIFMAIGVQIDLFRTLFIFPIIILATFFIPSLNGIGVQDFLYKFSNNFLLISEPSAIAASVLFHLFKLVVSLFGGVLYALGKSE